MTNSKAVTKAVKLLQYVADYGQRVTRRYEDKVSRYGGYHGVTNAVQMSQFRVNTEMSQ